MKLLQFIKNKGVIYAIILAVFYQIVMIGLYIYGYHVLPDGVKCLTVNVINQDGNPGAAIEKGLVPNLPFDKVVTDKDLKESIKELHNRQIQMIIIIPKDFIKNLATGKSSLNFYINESNTTTVVTTMKEVAKSITDNINQSMYQGKLSNILKSFDIDPAKQQIIAEQLKNSVIQNNIYINKAPGSMDYVMTPAFLSIATYASSMVSAIILMNILIAFIPLIGKWKSFYYVEITGCVIAILAPLFGMIMARILISISYEKFLTLYLQQVFMQITAFQFTLMFSLLLGQYGILANIPLLLAQTIAGGGTMPLQIMPGLFKFISYVTPMYPNTQIDFGLLFGGPKIIFELRLLAIFLLTFLLLLAIVFIKWPQKVKDSHILINTTLSY